MQSKKGHIMSEYTNSGYLFPNIEKKNEKAPDYKGKITIDGEEKQLAAWIKTSEKTGKKFLSVKWSEFYKKELGEPAKPVDQILDPVTEAVLDDLPF